MNFIYLYIMCFLLGVLGAYLMVKFGFRMKFVDIPNSRSSHSKPTPKGGGIGILLSFILSSLLIHIPYILWLPIVFIGVVSFFADRYEIKPMVRLILQILTGFMIVFGLKNNLLLIIPFTIFIIGTANIFNFMDGINGIAAIEAMIAFGLITLSKYQSAGVLSICVICSCLGFIPFNFPKARIFMGDVGSILLGFLFAAIVVWLSTDILDFICLSSFLLTFYADEFTSIYLRWRNKEKLTTPHRRHFYQILVNEKKISHWKISVIYGIVQFIIGISVILLKPLGIKLVLPLIILYISVITLLMLAFHNNNKIICEYI